MVEVRTLLEESVLPELFAMLVFSGRSSRLSIVESGRGSYEISLRASSLENRNLQKMGASLEIRMKDSLGETRMKI
jgi:hypothetical protein